MKTVALPYQLSWPALDVLPSLSNNQNMDVLLACFHLKSGQYPSLIAYHLHHAQVLHFPKHLDKLSRYHPSKLSMELIYSVAWVPCHEKIWHILKIWRMKIYISYFISPSEQDRWLMMLTCCMVKPVLVWRSDFFFNLGDSYCNSIVYWLFSPHPTTLRYT